MKKFIFIDNVDMRGLESIPNIREGTSSYTDLVIYVVNCHKIMKQEENFANSKFWRITIKVCR
jgi:hypothetical protein